MTTQEFSTRIFRSPRLPQEVLDAIVTHVEDKKLLVALSLTSTHFLQSTGRKLHSQLGLDINIQSPSAAEAFFKQYLWTSCIRVLHISYGFKNVPAHDPPAIQLHTDILVHFPRVETLNLSHYAALDRMWSLSASTPSFPSIKTLSLHTIGVSLFSSIARIIASFPSLESLELHRVDWDETDDDDDDYKDFLKNMPRPRIYTLDICHCCAKTLNNFLFPENAEVELREVKILTHELSRAEDWNFVLERAGPHLEKVLLQHAGQSGQSPFNLRANTNLKTLAMLFIEVDPHIGWVVQTIESLQSPNIEKILLENFEINYFLSELELMDLERMDEILSEERFNTLQCVMFSMIVIGAVSPTEEDEAVRQQAITIATSRMPKLNERGILHVGCSGFLEHEERTDADNGT